MSKNDLVIEKEEVYETFEKNKTNDIILKILKTNKGNAVDLRQYFYAKGDEGCTKPIRTEKGLWLSPTDAVDIGEALAEAGKKALTFK